ncbi:MAG TPA: endonuclease/exonuclease/phosphatase family protein [Turneriella sp.]|nr:endonuclease/exonuclease/phosphatase family protein [Turneriella sp.]HNA79473.1 endonuclease/exonuclease/phosphatase family protein [Turneriella sp.]HNE19491.1 endonuclease/exonuclease/phosphatase family protein [Turneriella sp.]HNJ66187.1 endonuclease/exonuclease/phosphatase family protein [Turneriella sp.]HNL09729.1 endonuclease/exonuclease/phosphatase family protein [Turneriella sp.]
MHKAIGNDRKFDPERIARVCEAEKADIIALQEVDNGVPRSRHLNLAEVLGEMLGYHQRLGCNVKLKVGSYGNATLSRWPFAHGQNLDLTWGIKKRRGCLSDVVETPRGPLVVMNFHLGLSRIERHFQLKKILASDFLHSHRSHPMLMLGDSNERTRYLDLFLSSAGFENTAGDAKRKYKTWPSFAPIWNLDKIFHNDKCERIHYEVVKNSLTKVASDHLPVKAVIRI